MSLLSVRSTTSPDDLEAAGPVFPIQIGLDETYEPGGLWESSAPLFSKTIKADALIDTGARVSCIDPHLAEELDLPVADERFLRGMVSEPVKVRTRIGHILVPELQMVRPLRFYEVDLSSWLSYRALLGRDLLRDCRMEYDGKPRSRGTLATHSARLGLF